MHATGPVTYDYQFDGRELFDQIVNASWRTPGTLFAYDGTTLALDDDELLGIEVGFHAPEFEQRKKPWRPCGPHCSKRARSLLKNSRLLPIARISAVT